MANFNQKQTMRTVNRSGYTAYRMPEKLKLVTQVLTSFFNEKKFYGDNSQEMKETIVAAIRKDAAFVAKLAVFARREFHMRTVAHVLVAHLAHEVEGKPYTRAATKAVCLRGDDATEILACYLSEFGKPVPNALKKGLADAMTGFDEYTLAKYKGEGKQVKMRDVLCICRPTPKDEQQSDMWKRLLNGELKTPYTWETELSAKGNTAEVWEQLIDSGKVGYMALLRNLRNIINANPGNVEKALATIEDPAAVRRSRQLPFRYLSAYKQVANSADSRVLDALENAAEAACENAPKLKGKTVIAVDVSGSMGDTISEKSDVRCSEIAMLLGMMASRMCERYMLYTFDTEIRKVPVSSRSGILEKAMATPFGGGTNMYLPFERMIAERLDADRVIILSDQECNRGARASWWGTQATVQQMADWYRRESGNDIWVHAIDLQGYGTQQFAGPKTNIIAGWSEKVLDFIRLAEQGEGSLVETIERYTL